MDSKVTGSASFREVWETLNRVSKLQEMQDQASLQFRKEMQEMKKKQDQASLQHQKEMKEIQKKQDQASLQHQEEMEERQKRQDQYDLQHQKEMKEIQKKRDQASIQHQKEMEKMKKKRDQADLQYQKKVEKVWAMHEENKRLVKQLVLQMQKSDNRINTRWGRLVESLVEGNLVKSLRAWGIDVTETARRVISERQLSDGTTEEREIDIIAANGIEAVAVEVKTTLSPKDVWEFLELMKNFKSYFKRFKKEKVYGAVAYLNCDKRADKLAEEQGLFVIKAVGDSAHIVNKSEFKPKAFS